MNSDSERTNGQLPEKDSGECAEKARENADDRDFGSEFVSDEILCGETEDAEICAKKLALIYYTISTAKSKHFLLCMSVFHNWKKIPTKEPQSPPASARYSSQ